MKTFREFLESDDPMLVLGGKGKPPEFELWFYHRHSQVKIAACPIEVLREVTDCELILVYGQDPHRRKLVVGQSRTILNPGDVGSNMLGEKIALTRIFRKNRNIPKDFRTLLWKRFLDEYCGTMVIPSGSFKEIDPPTEAKLQVNRRDER